MVYVCILFRSEHSRLTVSRASQSMQASIPSRIDNLDEAPAFSQLG